MAPVTISGVKKSFGAASIIHGVDIEIADGEFVVLVGPSGCGKSTLLRMIAGLESVTGGEIRISGRLVNTVAPKDRDVAMVFQNYALYPHMTVAENMGFSLKLAGRSKPEIAERVARAADILGLVPLLARLPKQLSGGQRQRVAMGRAIVRDPQVFLFDEPLSNLDAKLRVQMRTEIKALHQRLGTTTVYVTHDQVEAMTMADKIVVMHDGRVEQVGDPLELYDRPDNIFVAGFIGSPAMNMLAGRIEGGRFVGDDGAEFPAGPGAAELGNRRVIYGIRPEHFDPHPASEMDGETDAVGAEVVVVEPTGAESLVVVKVGNTVINCVFRDRIAARSGDRIGIRPRTELVHLFDEASGRRLGGEADPDDSATSGKSGKAAGHAPATQGAGARPSAARAAATPGLIGLLRSYVKQTYRPELHYMRGPGPRTIARRHRLGQG